MEKFSKKKKKFYVPKMSGLLKTKSWVSVPKMEKIKKENHVLGLKMEKLSKKKEKKSFGTKNGGMD